MTQTKTCRDCLIPKPLSAFARKFTNSDGRHSVCKGCKRKREKQAKAAKEQYSKTFFTH